MTFIFIHPQMVNSILLKYRNVQNYTVMYIISCFDRVSDELLSCVTLSDGHA